MMECVTALIAFLMQVEHSPDLNWMPGFRQCVAQLRGTRWWSAGLEGLLRTHGIETMTVASGIRIAALREELE